jgi:hypothetical protein
MPATLTRSLALIAFGALLIAALALFSPGTASAGEYCENLKGELCISLTPDPDTNPLGTDHTVTALGTVDGDPLDSAFEVGFVVYSGPNAGETDVVSMGVDGTAAFTYTGDGGPGTDNIAALFCDDALTCQGYVDDCAADSATCITSIEASCQDFFGPAGEMSAAGIQGFCFGPATAVKNREATPTPTPVDVGAGGQSPSPTATPAQLPASGGSAGGDGTSPILFLAIGAAVALAGAGSLALSRRRTAR